VLRLVVVGAEDDNINESAFASATFREVANLLPEWGTVGLALAGRASPARN